MNMAAEKIDVIVVGGGGAGLTAAIFARMAGAKVVLLEKAPKLGGSTSLCIGTYTASGTAYQKKQKIIDSPDGHFEDMVNVIGKNAETDKAGLRRILADQAAETLEWLVSLGMTFYGPVAEPPNRAPRMHNILPNSEAFIYFLEREARRVGVDIRLNASVEKLLVESGRVVGVQISGHQLRATRAVILATGDFSASGEWKGRYNKSVAHIDGVAQTSQGDGHRFGEALGAEVTFGEVVYGPNLRFMPPAKLSPILRLPPYTWITRAMRLALDILPGWLLRPFMLSFVTTYLSPEPSLFREGAIMVNKDGDRFADELDRPNYALALQPEKTGYVIFDNSVARKFEKWPYFVSTAPGVAYAYFQDYKRTRPDLYHKGATLDDLAVSIGVQPDRLKQAVESRNSDGKAPPLKDGPFHALGPVKSWIILSEGSLTVNANHQVTRADGSVINGLYAVGAVGQGGLLLPGHGTHLAWSFTSGRRAGRLAATAS